MRGAGFSSSKTLDDREDIGVGSVWAKLQTTFTSNASMTIEGWGQYAHANTGEAKRSKLREAFVDYSASQFDLRAGRQIIAWGRADKLNPTDNLTPRDYTLLAADDDDQRVGSEAMLLRYHPHGGDFTWSTVWQPKIRANVVPFRRPAGVRFSEPITSRDQVALKLDRSGGAVDWSVSYLDGVNLNPEFEVTSVSASGVDVLMRHSRVRVLGADAATVVGRYGLRTELAYTWTDPDRAPSNINPIKPFLYAVLGGDRTFDDSLNINLQAFIYRVSNYADPRGISDAFVRSVAVESAAASHQLYRHTTGFSGRINKKWLNDTLEAEMIAVVAVSSDDFVLKPKISYAINDSTKVTVGADVFRGRQETFFGRLRDASTVFAELKYSF